MMTNPDKAEQAAERAAPHRPSTGGFSTAGFARRRRRARQFLRNRDGATAIEFSLVALPFFALLFAIIETALIFWSSQVLETAVADAARRIYTGQFQNENSDPLLTPDQIAARFREDICARVTALFACNDLVAVDVRSFAGAFPSQGLPLPVNDGEFDASSFGYQSSGPSDIVVVRAAMAYPILIALMNPAQSNLNNGKRLIMATTAFRNEPFPQ
jgi:Flp pilus assembly protein TadG